MSEKVILKFDADGLIPTVVQDSQTMEILMVAWMNADSLKRTLRNELWHKGATSGNTQKVMQIKVDCDGDTLLLFVNPTGPACHTGARSCFYRSLDSNS
jgi:phosphoribosyl-AMP cyclohydrolase